MIIACPGCNKQYKLDPAKVKYTSLPGSDKTGVQLACSRCRTQWWQQEVSDSTSQAFEDVATAKAGGFRSYTDLSNLELNRDEPALKSTRVFERLAPQLHEEEESESGNGSDLMRRGRNNGVKPLRNYKKAIFAVVCAAVVMAAVAGVALYFKDDLNSALHGSLETARKPSKSFLKPQKAEPLVIDDVKYVQSRNNETQRVDIGGQVLNPNPFPVPVPSLMIVVSGACRDGRTPDAQGLCVLKKWPYKWKKTEIPGEESVLFEDSMILDPGDEVKQIDVDIIEGEIIANAAPDPVPPVPARAVDGDVTPQQQPPASAASPDDTTETDAPESAEAPAADEEAQGNEERDVV